MTRLRADETARLVSDLKNPCHSVRCLTAIVIGQNPNSDRSVCFKSSHEQIPVTASPFLSHIVLVFAQIFEMGHKSPKRDGHSAKRSEHGVSPKEDREASKNRMEGYVPDNIYLTASYNDGSKISTINSYEARARMFLNDIIPKIEGSGTK
ncbi:hypothetical protein E8E14_005805 [Neopestalotiopsis sp. 37M]|nr:hypothetical protein E8E14_005805 [Neopestalotiopsis sp. 37M]